jgi:hypothetical protein
MSALQSGIEVVEQEDVAFWHGRPPTEKRGGYWSSAHCEKPAAAHSNTVKIALARRPANNHDELMQSANKDDIPKMEFFRKRLVYDIGQTRSSTWLRDAKACSDVFHF